MSLLDLLFIAVALSMDAFAVALCKGLGMKNLKFLQAVIIALFFGLFQAGMPYIGWQLGKQFTQYIINFDHWIAFTLLLFIGGEMIWESFHKNDKAKEGDTKLNIWELFLMAIATSIDALAIGVSFAFLQTAIFPAIFLIGIITFFLSLFGALMGETTGCAF